MDKSYRNQMTFAQKGWVFKLHDSGNSIDEISNVTRYCPERLTCLIEALRGDRAWFDSKQAWREQQDGDNTKVGGQEEHGIRNRGKARGKIYSRKRTNNRTVSNTTSNTQKSTRYLSKSTAIGYNTPSKRVGVNKGRGKGGSTDSRIVTTFRQSKDYVGE